MIRTKISEMARLMRKMLVEFLKSFVLTTTMGTSAFPGIPTMRRRTQMVVAVARRYMGRRRLDWSSTSELPTPIEAVEVKSGPSILGIKLLELERKSAATERIFGVDSLMAVSGEIFCWEIGKMSKSDTRNGEVSVFGVSGSCDSMLC